MGQARYEGRQADNVHSLGPLRKISHMIAFEDRMRAGGTASIRQSGEFFMGTDPVHETLRAVTKKINSLGISYAVVGAMAMGAHGHVHNTTDVASW